MPPMLNHIKSTVTTVIYNFPPTLKSWSSETHMRFMHLTERRRTDPNNQPQHQYILRSPANTLRRKRTGREENTWPKWDELHVSSVHGSKFRHMLSFQTLPQWDEAPILPEWNVPPSFWLNMAYSDIYQLSRPPTYIVSNSKNLSQIITPLCLRFLLRKRFPPSFPFLYCQS